MKTINYVLLQGTAHQLGEGYDYLASHGLLAPEKYREVYQNTIEVEETEEPMETLERLFSIFNRDDRPNGQTGWSMSMGDITVMEGVPYLCDRFGFVRLENWGC